MIISIFSLLFFVGVLPFTDVHILEAVDPELLEDLEGIYTTSNYFSGDNIFMDNSANTSYLGLYIPNRRIIKVVNDSWWLDASNTNITKLLCHELMHHYWHTKMNSTQKQFWIDASKDSNDSPSEFHSEYYEDHWQRCFR